MDRAFINTCKLEVQRYFAEKCILVSYVRDKNGNPYGVAVAVRDHMDRIVYGYSQCNLKEDNFNRHVGIYIAVQRALFSLIPITSSSDEVFRTVCLLKNRAERYWKRADAFTVVS